MLLIWVTETWKLSDIFLNSYVKNSDLVQAFTSLKRSDEFLYLRDKRINRKIKNKIVKNENKSKICNKSYKS